MPLFPGPAMQCFRHTLHAAADTDVVVLTGRLHSMRPHVRRVLQSFGFEPSAFRLVCHPGGGQDTSVFKRDTIKAMWATHRYAHVAFYDDLGKTLRGVATLERECGVNITTVDATKMWSLPLAAAAEGSELRDTAHRTVESFVDETGLMQRPSGYDEAVAAGTAFVEDCWRSVLRAHGDDDGDDDGTYAARFDASQARALVFGSHAIGCLSDVDVCLLAPLVTSTYAVQPAALISSLHEALQAKGVGDVYLGDAARCPRLVARIKCSNGTVVTFDLVSVGAQEMDKQHMPAARY